MSFNDEHAGSGRTSIRDDGAWPAEIGFLPVIGSQYEAGVEGLRVLLLGESHYADARHMNKPAERLRNYTRAVFRGVDRPIANRGSWGPFFRGCDVLVSRNVRPTPKQAAEGWRRVAFANLVQSFVGDQARMRPEVDHWGRAKQAFQIYLDLLKPDVVLCLGSELFQSTPDTGEKLEHPIQAPRSHRNVWAMRREGGVSYMSWVYHPSWPNDSADTYVKVFNALLERARTKKAAASTRDVI